MQPVKELVEGLDILDSFLTQHGFEFDKYENEKGSGGQFTVATFVKGHKKFILNYHSSIRQVLYQFDKATVCHDFYIDQLRFTNKKKLPDFHSEDKHLAFKCLLHDFELLIEDFFDGECQRLKVFSNLQGNVITEYGGKARDEYKQKIDCARIEEARQKFRNKDFKSSLEIYGTVELRSLLNDLDGRLIKYCEHTINTKE